jgi:tetratricopeptide (TPR) repeat protein
MRFYGAVLLVLLSFVRRADAKTLTQTVPPESYESRLGGGVEIPQVHPLDLTPAMEAWVNRMVPRRGSAEARLRALTNHLLGPNGLGIQQARGPTTCAAQTFQIRRANCVAFAHLVVALSRRAGLRTYFVWTGVEGSTSRDSLRIGERHLAVGLGSESQRIVLDAGGIAHSPPGRFRLVSDETAAAVFHSNRGLETLLAHDVESALAWLETAARLDPGLDVAWLNLGVGLRRAGNLDRAEDAYRRALEINPDFGLARENLDALRQLRDRLDDAVVTVTHVPRRDDREP